MELNDDMVPRGVPKPSSFQETFNKPEVPEVSLLFDSKSPFERNLEKKANKSEEQPAKKIPDLAPISESYNVWRYKNAHLLNHVSSRSNSFQPAPLYNGSPTENGPKSYNSVHESFPKTAQQSIPVTFENGPTSYNPSYESFPKTAQQSIPVSFENGSVPQYNGVPSENGPTSFNPSVENFRPTQPNNLVDYNNKFYNQSPLLNGNHLPSVTSSAMNVDVSKPGQFTPSGNFPVSQENTCSSSNRMTLSDNRHQGPHWNNPCSNDVGHQNGYLALQENTYSPSNRNVSSEEKYHSLLLHKPSAVDVGPQSGYLMSQEKAYSPSNRIAPFEERHGSPLHNNPTAVDVGHQNGYHMNVVHFSSVTAPTSNCASTDLSASARNHATSNEFNRNYRDFQQCDNVPIPQVPHHSIETTSHCGRGVICSPYQKNNNYVTKNAERKVSFEEPPKNTFHSVSPCKCEDCIQKMYSKAMRTGPTPSQYLARNVETHQNGNRQLVATSPCSPNDRLNKVKKISTSDLYYIVQSQNEQLALLREKVDQLLSEKSTPACTHHHLCSLRDSPKKVSRTIAIQVDAEIQESERKSVGVMTSFQDKENRLSPEPQKTPPAKTAKDPERNGCSCNCNHQTSSNNRNDSSSRNKQETGDSQSRKSSPTLSPLHREKNDVSLTLNAANLPPVPEQILSPEPSVHVEMQDYHSSSDDDSVESVKQNTDDRNQNGKRNGWTFYDNVIGQVNNILQNSQDTACEPPPAPKDPISAVRQTTLEQLQKMGISVFDDKNSGDKRMGHEPPPCYYQSAPNKCDYRESDLSLHMNQLAMKYLNKDQFANAVGIQQDIAVCNMNGGTNLSFTTLRYLERYHLMPAEFKRDMPPGRECRANENFNHFQPRFENDYLHHQMPQPLTNKVLDITALKRQPKLL